MTFKPEEHPRAVTGVFVDKKHSAPEAALPAERPLAGRFDTWDEKLAAIQAELATAVDALADDTNWNQFLAAMSRFHNYSFGNQLLIAVQNPDATRVAGFRAWEALGRHVKKGERGLSILAPKVIRVPEKDAAGNPVVGADGKPVKRGQVIGFTGATVFDISQTEGEPLPEIQRELTEEPPAGFIDDLEAAITAQGYTVLYEDSLGQEDLFGATSPTKKTVRIKSGLSAGSRAQVLAHELGHIVAGHTENMAEYHAGHGGKRGVFEVEAESISHVLLTVNGMTTQADVTGTYIAGWARTDKTGEDIVRKAGETVARCVKGLLTGRKWQNVLAAG